MNKSLWPDVCPAFFLSLRRGRDSKLTASVQVSHFLEAELLKNMGEPFRIPHASKAVYLLLSANKKGAHWRSYFVMAEREGFEPSEPFLVQHLSRMLHSTALAPLRASTIDIPFLAVDL